MTNTKCEKDGVHVLPEGEDSWKSERCDTLVAAGLDRCLPCQDRLIRELSVTLTDDFGKLFTTWIMTTLNQRAALGVKLPRTALELFGRNGGLVISEASRKALRGITIPPVLGHSSFTLGFFMDTDGATSTLAAMSPSDREAVLGDAMDGIVMSIALPLRQDR
jgi:hypothetical protein